MNRITLIGRTGKDPEIRIIGDGTKVANFSLATTKHFTKNGEKQSQATWHNVVCWLKLADLAENYIHKGDQVCIEGEVNIRDWTDKDGNKRQSYEVVAGNIELLGSKKSEPAEAPESDVYKRQGKYDKQPGEGATGEHIQDDTPTDADDLPFAVTILLAVGTLIPMFI